MDVFTPHELAAKLGLKVGTILKYLREGELVGRKFGNRGWRITEKALERFLTTLEWQTDRKA